MLGHARKAPFEQLTLVIIDDRKKIYGPTLTAADSHQLTEFPGSTA
jgi:hypothetical protein